MDENQPQISNWSRVAVGWTFKFFFKWDWWAQNVIKFG